ncbi:MAG: tyrosine-protein phosphatase [Bdellovibrionota bacterium]
MLYKSIITAFFASLAFSAIANTAVDTPTGYYDKKESGFYQKNFDRSPDLSSSACKKFNELLLRGGKPEFKVSKETWIQKLMDNNVAIVFDLRKENTDSQKEKERLNAEGIDYVKLPLKTEGSDQDAVLTIEEQKAVASGETPVTTKTILPRTEATLSILKKIEEALASNKRIYLHCQRGEDRTGTIVALLRNCDEWRKEFIRYGGSLYPALAKHFKDVQAAQLKMQKAN